jgi:cell division protein FtsL
MYLIIILLIVVALVVTFVTQAYIHAQQETALQMHVETLEQENQKLESALKSLSNENSYLRKSLHGK